MSVLIPVLWIGIDFWDPWELEANKAHCWSCQKINPALWTCLLLDMQTYGREEIGALFFPPAKSWHTCGQNVASFTKNTIMPLIHFTIFVGTIESLQKVVNSNVLLFVCRHFRRQYIVCFSLFRLWYTFSLSTVNISAPFASVQSIVELCFHSDLYGLRYDTVHVGHCWKQPCENWISYSKIGAFWLNAKHSPKHNKKLSQKQIARMAIIVIVCEYFFHDFSFLNTCRCKNKQKYVLLQQYWQLMLHYVFTPCFKLFFPSFNSLVGVQKLCFLMCFPTHWCCVPSAVIVREATSAIYDMMFLQFDDELCWKERTWVLRKSC